MSLNDSGELSSSRECRLKKLMLDAGMDRVCVGMRERERLKQAVAEEEENYPRLRCPPLLPL